MYIIYRLPSLTFSSDITSKELLNDLVTIRNWRGLRGSSGGRRGGGGGRGEGEGERGEGVVVGGGGGGGGQR